MTERLTSVLLVGAIAVIIASDTKAQSARQQMIIDSVPNEDVRPALERALGGSGPAFPDGFLLPSSEPDPNKVFRPMTTGETAATTAAAGDEGQAAAVAAPEINVLGTEQVENYQGKVELFETVAGHLIARVDGQDLAFEIRLPGSSQPGSRRAVPLLAIDPAAGAGPQTGQIAYERTVSEGLSAHENLVLSQDGDLTVVRIEEGSATPYRRVFEDVGLEVEQVAPAAPNDPSSINIRYQDRTANLMPGTTTRIDTNDGSVEVSLIESFYTPVEELNDYREGDPYFISVVVRRVLGQ